MLSILIPTYHYNAVDLVNQLLNQLKNEKINFEIIVIDDASNSDLNIKNEQINQFKFCHFFKLEKNIGRSAIRNLLAKKAKYNWLLFLDVDVLPLKKDFIHTYLQEIYKNKYQVFCGGICYQSNKEIRKKLRYKYGKKYEEISIGKRQNNSFKYFFTSNFLIDKTVFQSILFEEKLKNYGREDMLFALNLEKNNIKIEHIQNNVVHLGIDQNDVFIAKTKNAMQNLMLLYKTNLINKNEIKLVKFITTLSRFKLTQLLSKFYLFFEQQAIKNSSLFFFNAFKICYLCYLKHKK